MRDIKTWDELKKEVKELRNLKENISFEDFSKSILLPVFKDMIESFEYDVDNRKIFSIHGEKYKSGLNFQSNTTVGTYDLKDKIEEYINDYLDDLMRNYSQRELENYVEKNATELGIKLNKEGKSIEIIEKMQGEYEDYSYSELCGYLIYDKLAEKAMDLCDRIEKFENECLVEKDILVGRKDDIIKFTNSVIIDELEKNNFNLIDKYDNLKQDIYDKWRNIKERHINEGKNETLDYYDKQNQIEIKKCLEEIGFYELLENEEDVEIVENLKYYEENHNYIRGIESTEKFEKNLKERLQLKLKGIDEDFDFEIPKFKEKTPEEKFKIKNEKKINELNRNFYKKISNLETENFELFYGNGYTKWRKNSIFDLAFSKISDEIFSYGMKENLIKFDENSDMKELKEKSLKKVTNLMNDFFKNKDFDFMENYLLKKDNSINCNWGNDNERIIEFVTNNNDIEKYQKDVIDYYKNVFINERTKYFQNNIEELFCYDKSVFLQNKNNLIEKFSKSNTEHIEKYIKLKEEIYNVWRDYREKQLELGNKDIEIRVDNKDVLKEFKELFKKVLENNFNIDDLKETLKNYENKYNKIHNITNIEEHKEEQIKKYELEKNKYIRQDEVENKNNKLELD